MHADGASGSPRRPELITPWHLERLALVYPRQSTPEQVRENTGSTAEQRELADLARQWGWPEDRIRILDADLGKSGRSTTNRTDFQKMVGLIYAGEAAIVFARDLQRLGRDAANLLDFRKLLASRNVLLYSEGQLTLPSADDPAKKLEFGVKSLFGEYDNDTRARNARQGRLKRAEQGHAVSRPPIGYVWNGRGQWTKDPDAEVQHVITRIFELAPKFRSLGAMVASMNQQTLRLPKRHHGQLSWEPASRARLYSILTNPQYTGAYVYQRFKVSVDPMHKKPRVERRPDHERKIIEHHHEPYVSPEAWEAIQRALAVRSPRQPRPVAGAGGALIQGLLRCPKGHLMHTTYSGRPGPHRIGSYRCQVRGKVGNTLHSMTCSARLLDPAVVDEVLRVLRPLEMNAALASVADARHEHTSIVRRLRRGLQQAQDEAEELYEQYCAADVKNSHAKAALEAKWNGALARSKECERRLAEAERSQPVPLSQTDAADLLRLGAKIDALWNGPETTNRDRKEILRTVLSEVTVTSATDEAIELSLVWVGGLRQPLRVLRPRGLDERVRELARAGNDAATIARQFRAESHTTAKGNPMTREAVYVKLGHLGLGRTQRRREMMLVLRQMLIDGARHDDIRARLAKEFPGLCQWTRPHLNQLITELRRGGPDIPALPAVLPRDREKQAVLAFVHRHREAGDTWEMITAKLNESDLRPQRNTKFKVNQVAKLYRYSTRRERSVAPIGADARKNLQN